MLYRIIILLLLPVWGYCQNTIGLPDVINYSKQSYKAGLQNWDITQDKNGVMYIANNEGLLTFDGKYWNLYPLPNKTIVRSAIVGADSRIYVGGQDELGYFFPEKNGQLKYHSLIELIPQKDKNFGDVWDIVSVNKDVFFRSTYKILKFSNEKFAVFNATSEWSYLGVCNKKLYSHDFTAGLMVFENNVWNAASTKSELPKNEPVTSILNLNNDSLLITTLKNGLFISTKAGITKLASANNALLAKQHIYAATKISNNRVALATTNNGVYIIDNNVNIVQTFAQTEGLQNSNVLSIFLDQQSNLWLGLDNGIAFIAYNSSIKHISPVLQDYSGYTATIYNNKLYAGTSNGLYSVTLQPTKDFSFSKGAFQLVDNTNGQVWGLSVVNNQLLMGHHEGAFVVKDNTTQSISNNPGFWNFTPLSNIYPTAQIISGDYKGLFLFDYQNNQFIPSKHIDGFAESSRFVAIDNDNTIWVSHPYHGVYKIVKSSSGSYITTAYNNNNGLPSALNNHVYKIKNEVVVATEKGVYTFNQNKNTFEPSAFYTKFLDTQSIRYLKEDASGNIWFIHEKNLGVIDLSGKDPLVVYLPELNNKMLSGFEFIYPVNDNNIFVGGEKGFFHINYEKYKQNVPNLHVQIRSVRIMNTKDSLLFGGYFRDINETQLQEDKTIPSVANDWKTIRFEFSSSLFGYQNNLEYSYRLTGFEKNWSPWEKRTEKEYTNLPEGKYVFEVKVRNNLGSESTIATYTFKVLPPWYQTIWAKLFYVLLFVVAVIFLYNKQKKKFIQQQQKHDEEQKRLLYILELERNKTESTLVTLRNENLEADISFKNSELASSAMHLVKKGELIAKVKSELSHLMKSIDNAQAASEIKKMIKTISEDDNMDKEWESFTKHFDKVHSDFLIELKEKHPTVTANELKLCAYLRMNLSTKEIAQLMNISVRGVEISRYRLRKKLGIPSETTLFDYLINIQSQA